MQILRRKEYARFSEMRPEKTDSNLYSYHLNRLISSGYINKTDLGYTLSTNGLRYVEYTNSNMAVRNQPKITTSILLNNENGDILLTKRLKQPYIGYYGLPLGKIHSNEDKNILESAIRELHEKSGVKYKKLNHIGDIYLKIHLNKLLISDLLSHVFSATCKQKIAINESSMWVAKKDLGKINLVPGAREIINLVYSGERFFEEISV